MICTRISIRISFSCQTTSVSSVSYAVNLASWCRWGRKAHFNAHRALLARSSRATKAGWPHRAQLTKRQAADLSHHIRCVAFGRFLLPLCSHTWFCELLAQRTEHVASATLLIAYLSLASSDFASAPSRKRPQTPIMLRRLTARSLQGFARRANSNAVWSEARQTAAAAEIAAKGAAANVEFFQRAPARATSRGAAQASRRRRGCDGDASLATACAKSLGETSTDGSRRRQAPATGSASSTSSASNAPNSCRRRASARWPRAARASGGSPRGSTRTRRWATSWPCRTRPL